MTFAQTQPQNTPSRGLLTRLAKVLFPPPKPVEPTPLDRARLSRDAAKARYTDAVLRGDTRDVHAYRVQLINATSRVLRLEMGVGS
jgi:hypothetical protein